MGFHNDSLYKLVEYFGFEKDTKSLKIKFQGKKCQVLRDPVM